MSMRWMIRKDLPAVVAIERASFHTPWTEEDFANELRRQNVYGMVVENDHNEIVGYVVTQLNEKSYTIRNIAVRSDYFGCGVGDAIIEKLELKCTPKRPYLYAMVAESNLRALMFFKRNGFQAVDLIKEPYSDATDDGIVMRLTSSCVAKNSATASRRDS